MGNNVSGSGGVDEKAEYFRCQRLVRIWSVVQMTDGQERDCCSFFRTTLLVLHEVIQSLKIKKVEKQGQNRRSKIVDEVLVQFKSQSQRNILMQLYAINLGKLPGKACLCMEIPHHLLGASLY